MKISKFTTLFFMSLSLMATSCLDDNDGYNSGFTMLATKSKVLYANNTSDSLYVHGLGPWQLQPLDDSKWCTMDRTSGDGYVFYSIGMKLQMNTTGKQRQIPFTIFDTRHTDTGITFQLKQMATRGDGSLGNAALVKTIESTDGYTAQIEYDSKARPVSYVLTGNDGSTDRMTINYDELAGQITVNHNNSVMTGKIDNSYQPTQLVGTTDTVAYKEQYYSNGMPISYNYAFNFVASNATKGIQAYSYLLSSEHHPKGQSLSADSLHVADSVRYVHQNKINDTKLVEMLALNYGPNDNRCQSVDVNQLLLGFKECHPMQLLSLFRYTRSTSIVSEAKSVDGNINVTTTLNDDKSVRMMTVERGVTSVTYTFTY
ncbi:MAG: hypothetical protein K2J86_06485 [Prevotella sp.]|nr:hypothetical protein [Prevotella sp.]MDE6689508.1 hypothetical protein [Prevotella sp.]